MRVNRVGSAAADDRIVAPARTNEVIAATAVDVVVAVVRADGVAAAAAVNSVVAIKVRADNVVPGAAVNRVVAVVALKLVIAGAANDGIVAALPAYRVPTGAADKRIVAPFSKGITISLSGVRGYPAEPCTCRLRRRSTHVRQLPLPFALRAGPPTSCLLPPRYRSRELNGPSTSTAWWPLPTP